jgi:hypothetical protein
MSFFTKTNFHSFIWALFSGTVIFLLGVIWKSMSGPDKVKIIRDNISIKDTTYTIVKFEENHDTSKKASISYEENNKYTNLNKYGLTNKQIELLIENTLIKRSKRHNEELSIIENNIAFPSRPLFILPKIVSGYQEANLNSYGSIVLENDQLGKSDFIKIHVQLFNPTLLDKMTPLFVDISKSSGSNAVTQIWSDQFTLNSENSIVKFSTSNPSGSYILTIGFYLKNDLNKKYPSFYSKHYNIKIK